MHIKNDFPMSFKQAPEFAQHNPPLIWTQGTVVTHDHGLHQMYWKWQNPGSSGEYNPRLNWILQLFSGHNQWIFLKNQLQ